MTKPIEKKPRWRRKPEYREEELIAAALDVFSGHGYKNSSLVDVARKAGVTKGVIYYYFRDKEHLLVTALTRSLKSAKLMETQLHQPGLSNREKLRKALITGWARWTNPGFANLYRLFVGEIAQSHPLIYRKWLTNGPSRTSKTLAAIIRDGQAAGEFDRDLDPILAGRFILSSLTSQAVVQPLASQRNMALCSKDQLLESALELFLRSLDHAASKGK
jgi:AcrR family transcriptional regulator